MIQFDYLTGNRKLTIISKLMFEKGLIKMKTTRLSVSSLLRGYLQDLLSEAVTPICISTVSGLAILTFLSKKGG